MSKGQYNIVLVVLRRERRRDPKVLSIALKHSVCLAVREKKANCRHDKMIILRHCRNKTSACQSLCISAMILCNNKKKKI